MLPDETHLSFGGRMQTASPLRVFLGYAAMIGLTILLFFAIRSYGETLAASRPAAAPADRAAPGATSQPLLRLLVAMVAVIALGRLLARLFAFAGQPPVIGEVLAGICLGPSLLGRVAPEAEAWLLPASVAPALSVVANLGVIFYMFVVGLELNAGLCARRGTSRWPFRTPASWCRFRWERCWHCGSIR